MDKWIEKKDHWLNGHTPKKKKIKAQSDNKNHSIEGVVYHPVRCPKCKSKNVKCDKTALPIRYHFCKDCKNRFKSVESDD
ncbi:MAG: hypothetical protein KAT34_10605 [Candidatus Aminicenantes bacterium]|nr:hypothetical protein [Candidatus Aminicenantes bacterium]